MMMNPQSPISRQQQQQQLHLLKLQSPSNENCDDDDDDDNDADDEHDDDNDYDDASDNHNSPNSSNHSRSNDSIYGKVVVPEKTPSHNDDGGTDDNDNAGDKREEDDDDDDDDMKPCVQTEQVLNFVDKSALFESYLETDFGIYGMMQDVRESKLVLDPVMRAVHRVDSELKKELYSHTLANASFAFMPSSLSAGAGAAATVVGRRRRFSLPPLFCFSSRSSSEQSLKSLGTGGTMTQESGGSLATINEEQQQHETDTLVPEKKRLSR